MSDVQWIHNPIQAAEIEQLQADNELLRRERIRLAEENMDLQQDNDRLRAALDYAKQHAVFGMLREAWLEHIDKLVSGVSDE
ncbi:MAG: hypothetical protein ACYSUK_00220 [Planctomycetota bacterium]|jgi:cell division protein FtsB